MTHFPIKDLKRAEYNPRVMPDSEMQSLIKSIETHGFVEPIVVNVNKERYGVIVGGHQRLTAVEKLIAKDVIPKGILHSKGSKLLSRELDAKGEAVSGLMEVTGWDIPAFEVDLTLEAEKQLNIGLNKIHGKFDEDKLYGLIVEMKESPTLPTTGFREDEVSMILDRNNEDPEEEETEGVMKEPESKFGEIYELGEHRLICGDSTDPETYNKLFGDLKPTMCWTDPPYNVDYEGKTEEKMQIKNDKLDPIAFKSFIDSAFREIIGHMITGGTMYICSGWSSYPQFLDSMMKNGFYHSGVIIWVKNNATFGFSDYKYKHEWIAKAEKKDLKTAQGIIYGWSQGKHTFYGDNEFDVWEMPRRTSNRNHPTEKPDWLPMRAIRNSTKRGDIVLDPFSGSGSVMSACEKTGRRAFMIELDPKFCDVIRKRYAGIVANKLKQTNV
jgi:DNA modification methylase